MKKLLFSVIALIAATVSVNAASHHYEADISGLEMTAGQTVTLGNITINCIQGNMCGQFWDGVIDIRLDNSEVITSVKITSNDPNPSAGLDFKAVEGGVESHKVSRHVLADLSLEDALTIEVETQPSKHDMDMDDSDTDDLDMENW